MSAMPAEAEPRRVPGAAQPRVTEPRVAEPRLAETPEGEPRRARRALTPATAGRRQAGLTPRPVVRRPRPAGAPPRLASRPHPTGVRACSGVTRAEPPTAALPVPQARPSRPADDARSLRLTRRGRVVLAVCAAVVAGLIGLAAASAAWGPGSSPGRAGHSLIPIVVQPGQTLWSIAVRADPQADPRLVVQRIIAANTLPDGSIQAGQRLLVPQG